MKPSDQDIAHQVASALAEDIGTGDISAALIDSQQTGLATLYCREQAILCGTDWFDQSLYQLDPDCSIHWLVSEGECMQPDQRICTIAGSTRALLSGERTALNFLQTLSGVATSAASYAQFITGSQVQILDTRKTLPGLRLAQKYAVTVGGCHNHRIGLYDAFLIKENHIANSESIAQVIARSRQYRPDTLVEIEVETIDQLTQAIAAGADIVMLDNFTIEAIKQAVDIAQRRVKLEVSGNINQENLPQLIALGIDYISIGALTKHVKAVDFSLRFGT